MIMILTYPTLTSPMSPRTVSVTVPIYCCRASSREYPLQWVVGDSICKPLGVRGIHSPPSSHISYKLIGSSHSLAYPLYQLPTTNHQAPTLPHNTPHLYSFMMTSTNDLSTPLLGNLPRHHERDDEQDAEYDEEVCMIGHADSSQEESQDGQSSAAGDESPSSWWFANCVLALVLSTLLFCQFGIAFHMFPAEATAGLCWSEVNYSIVLYAIVAALYRQSVKDCDMYMADTTFYSIIFLPEILMDTILVLVLFYKVVAAFWLLQCGILFLAVATAASKIRLLLSVSVSVTPSTSSTASTAADDTTRPISSNLKTTTNSLHSAQMV
jgi:hypothetical protein